MLDPSKREETILNNMGLVLFALTQMETEFPPLMSYDDARQSGYLGLILAVDSYDEQQASFSTYALMKIKATIMEAMDDYGYLKRCQRRRAASWDRARREVEADQGEELAGMEEISRHLDISVTRGRTWERYTKVEFVYLDSCREIDLWRLREDEAKADAEMETRLESDELRNAMKALSPEEKTIIEQIFFLNRSQREIQERYGIGKNYLRDVKKIALRKMRMTLENEGRPPESLKEAEMEEGRTRPRKTGKMKTARA